MVNGLLQSFSSNFMNFNVETELPTPATDPHDIGTGTPIVREAQAQGVKNSAAKGKRNLSDLSLDTETAQPQKYQNFTASSPINPAPLGAVGGTLTQEQAVVKAMETCMSGLYSKLDALLTEVGSVKSELRELREQGNRRDEQLDELLTRLRLSEDKCQSLESRVGTLESGEGWSPSPNTDIQVKLIGDSNFSGKVKFGNVRGTLGGALPGDSTFCAKVEDLPEPEDLVDCTDVIIAVGTNNLKQTNVDPTTLAVQFYRKIKSYSNKLPNTHFYINGVLPTTSSDINSRIKEFNRHLDDMCNSRTKFTYMDNKVFCKPEGSLADKFRVDSDEIHVNEDGTKLIASRIKFALRQRHYLPNGNFVPHNARRRQPRQNGEHPAGTEGNYRGRGHNRRGSNRGGRGRRGGGPPNV